MLEILVPCVLALGFALGWKLRELGHLAERAEAARGLAALQSALKSQEDLVTKWVQGHDNLTYAAALAIKANAQSAAPDPTPQQPVKPEEMDDVYQKLQAMGVHLSGQDEEDDYVSEDPDAG